MEVSDQYLALTALFRGKEAPAPIEQEAKWAPETAGTFLKKKKFLASAQNP
jgi:hypothetical protein